MTFRSVVVLCGAAAVGCSDTPGTGEPGSADGGGSGPGAVDAAPADARQIDGEPLTWTWIDVPGATCMNDTATGLGINLNPGSNKLMIYLEGGGACFNAFTCSGVAHQDGFNANHLAQFASDYGDNGVFNREDGDNPFKDWNMVFIPYCTGDIFAGSNPDGFGGRNQVGFDNMGAYLDLLVPAFADADHVVLTGSSAGGFGAMYNFPRAQEAFGDTPVTLLNDSGPPMSDDYMTPCLQQQVRDLWNLDATLPQDCADCFNDDGGGLINAVRYAADKYPDRRFGLISSTTDGVIRLFYGWGYPNCSNPQVPMPADVFRAGLAQLRDEVLAPYPNFRVYTIESGLHVWLLENPLGTTNVTGVSLTDWIREMIDGNEDWQNVVP